MRPLPPRSHCAGLGDGGRQTAVQAPETIERDGRPERGTADAAAATWPGSAVTTRHAWGGSDQDLTSASRTLYCMRSQPGSLYASKCWSSCASKGSMGCGALRRGLGGGRERRRKFSFRLLRTHERAVRSGGKWGAEDDEERRRKVPRRFAVSDRASIDSVRRAFGKPTKAPNTEVNMKGAGRSPLSYLKIHSTSVHRKKIRASSTGAVAKERV